MGGAAGVAVMLSLEAGTGGAGGVAGSGGVAGLPSLAGCPGVGSLAMMQYHS